MKANMNLIEPEEDTEHGAVRLRFDISKHLHDNKDKKKVNRETVYRWMALLFAAVTFLGVAYLFGISDVFSVGKQVEHKDYRAEELLNAQTVRKQQEKLSEDHAELYVNDAPSQDEVKTDEKVETGEESATEESESLPVQQKEEEEPVGEEF